MPKRKRSGIDKAAEKIAASIEKSLAELPRAERNTRLEKIHRIASGADRLATAGGTEVAWLVGTSDIITTL